MEPLYVEPPLNIIGVAGKKGSGKSHMTALLARRLGFVPLALARHFKCEAVVMDDRPAGEVFGDEERSSETRRYLQHRGTEQGRYVHGEDVWCRILEARIRDMVQHGASRFAISDIRFPNEARWIQALGGVVYKLEGRNRLNRDDTDEHPSETAMDGFEGWDRVIDNSPGRELSAEDEVLEAAAEDLGVLPKVPG